MPITCRYVGVMCTEALRVLFHPASLLTVGDTLAFAQQLFTPNAAEVEAEVPKTSCCMRTISAQVFLTQIQS